VREAREAGLDDEAIESLLKVTLRSADPAVSDFGEGIALVTGMTASPRFLARSWTMGGGTRSRPWD
jgi:hypothetical protein